MAKPENCPNHPRADLTPLANDPSWRRCQHGRPKQRGTKPEHGKGQGVCLYTVSTSGR